jgi:phytoene desaturase
MQNMGNDGANMRNDGATPGRTVIVGAGVGGLATAIRLAHAGQRVTLVERNATVGGRANELCLDGHRFDTGPTLLLMPDVYRELFAGAGRDLDDYVSLVAMEPNYRVHFADGRWFDASRDLEAMAAGVDRIEPGAGRGIRPFLVDADYKYRVAREKFVGRNFRHAGEFITPGNLVELWKTGALANLFRHARRYFRDERLRLAFTFQTMYLGISPLEAPAIYALLPYTELVEGIWYPQGGVYRLVEAMRRLAEELGATIRTDAEVTALRIEGERVAGVLLADGTALDADVVVANADLPGTYRRFVPERLRPDFPDRRLRRLRYTASAYVLYLGVDRVYEQLRHHNVFFAEDFRANFDAIFRTRRLPAEPSLYIAAPGRTDPTVAPPGHDALMVLVPVPHLARDGVDWARDEPDFRRQMLERLERLGLTDLRRRIVVQRQMTPLDWRDRYALTAGAAFGLAHDFRQVGYLRPNNRAKKLRNLYFVGASTVPGTGVPMAIIGSRLVTERILREQGAGCRVPGAGRGGPA